MQDILLPWVWFSQLKGIPPRKRWELLRCFSDPVNLWHASAEELQSTGIVNAYGIGEIIGKRAREEAERNLENARRQRISVVRYIDPQYPTHLKDIYNPPVILYVKGKLNGNERCMAVVGSRKATEYGLSIAESIAYELSLRGITIVSGMARGVDSRAHNGALRAGGGTIAILGCGLDIVYPRENERLMEEIALSGAVVSEFAPGTPPKPAHFPMRNRIISGMSMGVAVIEAGERSGSLITADFALEQGREVFAVPGNINSTHSAGTNRLIREGAKIVTEIDDILEELKIFTDVNNNNKQQYNKAFPAKSAIPAGLDEDEQRIFKCLTDGDLHIDIISSRCNLSIQHVNATLIMLELKGLVKQQPGKIFGLNHKIL